MTTEKAPYNVGYDTARAFYLGKIKHTESHCPYPEGSEDAHEWYAGNNDFYRNMETLK